jgi:hypothetical protein
MSRAYKFFGHFDASQWSAWSVGAGRGVGRPGGWVSLARMGETQGTVTRLALLFLVGFEDG